MVYTELNGCWKIQQVLCPDNRISTKSELFIILIQGICIYQQFNLTFHFSLGFVQLCLHLLQLQVANVEGMQTPQHVSNSFSSVSQLFSNILVILV